jgi:hypothetical protein
MFFFTQEQDKGQVELNRILEVKGRLCFSFCNTEIVGCNLELRLIHFFQTDAQRETFVLAKVRTGLQ